MPENTLNGDLKVAMNTIGPPKLQTVEEYQATPDGIARRTHHSGSMEQWLKSHSNKMQLIRTISSTIAACCGMLVFLKIFGYL